jgi:hypothetical protein
MKQKETRNRFYWEDCKCIQCGKNFKASRRDAKFCNDNGGKCKAAYHREEKKLREKIQGILNRLDDIDRFAKRYGYLPNWEAELLNHICLFSGAIKDRTTHQEALPIMSIANSALTEKSGSHG